MGPHVECEDREDATAAAIRNVEQVEWVEWASAQATPGTHLTDRDSLHSRETTEVDFAGLDGRDECIRQLDTAFRTLFDEEFVDREPASRTWSTAPDSPTPSMTRTRDV